MKGARLGWVQILLGLIVLGLIVRYWYVAVPLIIGVTALVIWRRHRVRAESVEAERLAEAGRLERQARRYASLEAASRSRGERVSASSVAVPVGLSQASDGVSAAVSNGIGTETTSAHEFDVALSFAGKDRGVAHAFAESLRTAGVRVFYDEFLEADMWGEDMVVYFDEVFRKKARYVVAFVSHHYVTKPWTNLERRSVQARFLTESGPSLLLSASMTANFPGCRRRSTTSIYAVRPLPRPSG
jgi:hypothetical protein